MEAPHLLIFAICCLSLISSGAAAAAAAKVGGEFSYDPCSDRGPKHWGELDMDWGMCKNGKLQSPISLSKWTAHLNQGLGDLRRRHRPANAYLKNDGHEIVVSIAFLLTRIFTMSLNSHDFTLSFPKRLHTNRNLFLTHKFIISELRLRGGCSRAH